MSKAAACVFSFSSPTMWHGQDHATRGIRPAAHPVGEAHRGIEGCEAKLLDAKDRVSKTFQNKLATVEEAGRSFEKLLSLERLEKEALSAEVTALEERVRALSVKPFDEAQLGFARGRVEALQYYERDVLRFLLVNGESRGDGLHTSTTMPGGTEINSLTHNLVQRGLVTEAALFQSAVRKGL
jgi:hypothetical protein